MPNDNIELTHVYAILRKLRCVRNAEPATPIDSVRFPLDPTIFPQRFILKQLEARLADIDEFACNLVSVIFKRLLKEVETNHDYGPPQTNLTSFLRTSKCSELDEYFHSCLHYLHDFFVDLEWHEPEIEKLDSGFKNVDAYFRFRRELTNFGSRLISPDRLPEEKASYGMNQGTQQTKKKETIRYSLSQGLKIGPPMRKRRVRFTDMIKADGKKPIDDTTTENLQNIHSLQALDLLLFSLSLFCQRLCDTLTKWASSSLSGIGSVMALPRESRRKVKTNQLQLIAKQIKHSSKVYITVLEYISDLRKIYLHDYIRGILYNPGAGHALKTYKTERISIMMQKIILDAEARAVLCNAEQSLQILFDLITSEMNLPPIDLDAKSTEITNANILKDRESYLDPLLDIHNLILGANGSSKGSLATNISSLDRVKQYNDKSTIADGAKFKSSSRISTRMDNLNELMRGLLFKTCDGMKDKMQLKYFLELVQEGLNQFYDRISTSLISQLRYAMIKLSNKLDPSAIAPSLKDVNSNIDLVAVKMRCMKFVQILSLVDVTVKETALRGRVDAGSMRSSLITKLYRFTESLTQQSGEIFMS